MVILVESAIKLGASELSALESIFKKKVDGKFTIDARVSEEILGGLRVTIGSKRIDVSLKGKLEQVKKQLE